MPDEAVLTVQDCLSQDVMVRNEIQRRVKFLSMTVKEPSGISAQLRQKSRPDFEKWTVIKPRGLIPRLGLFKTY